MDRTVNRVRADSWRRPDLDQCLVIIGLVPIAAPRCLSLDKAGGASRLCNDRSRFWHPAGFIADDDLGAATTEASGPARPVPMLPSVTTAILPAKLN
jgi:hypothetical protein